MNIYFNGCSHSTAECCNTKRAAFSYIVASSILGIDNYYDVQHELQIKSLYDIQHNKVVFDGYYEFFFKHLDENKNNVINHSEGGKSNDKIFYQSVTTLYESIKFNKKIDLFIIQWSGPNRRLHTLPSNEEQYTKSLNINPHDNVKYGIKFEPFASNQTLQYMIILQDLLKKYNIEYVFVPYMELDSESLKLSNIESLLDKTKLTTDIKIGHRNEIRAKGISADYSGHPSELANYYIASKILDVLGFGDSLIGFFEYFKSTSIKNIRIPNPEEYRMIKKEAYNLEDGDSAPKKLI